MVGRRDACTANLFVQDLASRLANRVQFTSDGLHLYINAVEAAFGADVDFAMLVKLYGGEERGGKKRYSSADVTRTMKRRIMGNPDVD